MATYSATSPYYKTNLLTGYLDILNITYITPQADDLLMEITKNYEYRPDLLAYDLYGDSSLWWVFALRNKDVIKDSIFDLEVGIKIYVPSKQNVINFTGS